MLKSLRVQNFKSLVDFTIDFEPFTVLIGKNGSGKTTVLQALELLSAFIQGDVNHFLERRGWKAVDLFSSFSEDQKLSFELAFDVSAKKIVHISWRADLILDDGKLILNEETMGYSVDQFPKDPSKDSTDFKPTALTKIWNYHKGEDAPYAKSENQQYIGNPNLIFSQSPLGMATKISEDSTVFRLIRDFLENIFLLDIQDSEALRIDSEKTERNISRNGKDLAGFLTSFSVAEMKELNANLKKLIPQAFRVATEKGSRDKLQLVFTENYPTIQPDLKNVRIWPEHISDGTLRIVALLATIQGAKPGTTLLLDEIENGIDPTQMGLLVQMMDEQIKKKGIQVILSTHSPVALNYVPEEGIRYFKRKPDGNVTATNIFENGELKKMLEYMNAGEIWLNLEEKELLGGE